MWKRPKTNWNKDDYFNTKDFNRIKNNITHLRELSIRLYDNFDIPFMGNDKKYSDFFYADEINLIENNFEIINQNTLKQKYGDKKTYVDNGNTMTYEELNRLENAILDLKDKLTNQSDGKRCLKFNFGKRGGL